MGECKDLLNAEIFIGGKKCETILGALSLFNKNDINFEHSGVALYLIYSTVSLDLLLFNKGLTELLKYIACMDDNANIHPNDLSPQYYDFVGDIQSVSSNSHLMSIWYSSHLR